MQNHEKWLLKANNDLEAAKVLCEANCLDVAIYHTQQAAEKALKGLLAAWKHLLVKTHNLVTLVALCKQFDPKIALLGSLAEKLTPFAVTFRYPDVGIYPKKQTVLDAIRDAEKIVRTVEERILHIH
jgi:HEPN domain-containing protein